jgi:hypothetical protein
MATGAVMAGTGAAIAIESPRSGNRAVWSKGAGFYVLRRDFKPSGAPVELIDKFERGDEKILLLHNG